MVPELPPPNLIMADLVLPSFPGSNCSTRASLQNALGVESPLTITMSPSDIEEPEPLMLAVADVCSRKPVRYPVRHCFVNCFSKSLWC